MDRKPAHQTSTDNCRRTGGRHAGLLVVLAAFMLLTLPSATSAAQLFCSDGSAAGQCNAFREEKNANNEIEILPGFGPGKVAADTSTGDPTSGRVYLADRTNNRIDVFSSSGGFLFAFGWNVNASTPEEKLQTCTTGTGCQKGSGGPGAGQLSFPEKIAVDPVSHAIYVTEQDNFRLQKFDAEGQFLWMAGGGVDKVTHANLCTVAVNCGAGVEAQGKVGEEEGRFFSNLIFGLPVSVGPGGVVYVADSRKIGAAESEGFDIRVQKFAPSGAYSGLITLPGPLDRVFGLAVDATGDSYVSIVGGRGGVYRYDSVGNPVTTWGEEGLLNPSSNISDITLDSAGNLLVLDGKGGASGDPTVFVYDSDGVKVRVLFPPPLKLGGLWSIAYLESTDGDLLITSLDGLRYFSFPPPGPVLAPGSTVADPVGNVKATLKVTFNPQGKASTARFEYVDKASFDQAVSEGKGGFESPNTKTTPESEPSPADFDSQTVSATNVCAVPSETTCLEPGTTYYFRAIAKNPDGDVIGEKAEFTTRPSHGIDAVWVSDVGTDTARLHAEVNPLGIQASGYFQYIADGPDYEANGFANALDAPDSANPLEFGSGEEPVNRVAQLIDLEPGITYHFRLVITDPFFPALISAEQSFSTFALPEGESGACSNQAFRTGASGALPDCRAYEMVSPLDKNNGDILSRLNATGFRTDLDQASLDGNGFAYTSYRAFADPRSAPFTNQYLARRNANGWGSENLSPPRTGLFRFELETPFQAFSPDLSQSWMLQEGEPTLDPCAPVGVAGLYRRESAGGAYRALSCAPIGQIAKDTLDAGEYWPELQGFSADGSKALIRIDDKLTADASTATAEAGSRPIYQTYLSTGAGQLRLVSVLPDGQASAMDSSGGTALINTIANHNRSNSVQNAISTDGNRVFWTAATSNEFPPAAGTLYLRLNADQVQSNIKEGKCNQPTRACTIPVSETVSPQPAFFQTANPQGTEALFTITSGSLTGNLYRFDAGAKPPASELVAERVQGNILGASDDLARIYFVSTAASAQAQSEGAASGEPNVYLDEEGTTRFIGTLSSPGPGNPHPDTTNFYGTPINKQPVFRTARVSPDGQSLVFMSNSREIAEETAGYDNRDLANDQPDLEVYLYTDGALRCVSCNPTGGRPRGREVEDGLNGTEGVFAAATVPLFQNQHFQPRYLSDDGSRVYFNSFEALVLSDTNGKQDVYQWEAPGSGNCTAQSPAYVGSSEGCLSLISSGQSPEDSAFLDATPSGSDVFFTTGESLLEQDYGLIDIYDARVNGGFPPPPSPPPACEGEACQGPLEAPNDPTPASSTFQGAGNVVEKPPAKKKHKKKHKVKKKGKKGKQGKKHSRADGNRRTHR